MQKQETEESKDQKSNQQQQTNYKRISEQVIPKDLKSEKIYSCAYNPILRQILICDSQHLRLFNLETNKQIRQVSLQILVRQELNHLTDKKREEEIQKIIKEGVQHLNCLVSYNIWMAVIKRRNFIFFNEQLQISQEISGEQYSIKMIQILQKLEQIITLTEDYKIQPHTFDLPFEEETKKKRKRKKYEGDFDFRLQQKKSYPHPNQSTYPFIIFSAGDNNKYQYLAAAPEPPTSIISSYNYEIVI